MHKAFPPLEVLISKGESFNFSLPSVCIGKGRIEDMAREERQEYQGSTNARVEERIFFSFILIYLFGCRRSSLQ